MLHFSKKYVLLGVALQLGVSQVVRYDVEQWRILTTGASSGVFLATGASSGVFLAAGASSDVFWRQG
jgi:hypothetical protein